MSIVNDGTRLREGGTWWHVQNTSHIGAQKTVDTVKWFFCSAAFAYFLSKACSFCLDLRLCRSKSSSILESSSSAIIRIMWPFKGDLNYVCMPLKRPTVVQLFDIVQVSDTLVCSWHGEVFFYFHSLKWFYSHAWRITTHASLYEFED